MSSFAVYLLERKQNSCQRFSCLKKVLAFALFDCPGFTSCLNATNSKNTSGNMRVYFCCSLVGFTSFISIGHVPTQQVVCLQLLCTLLLGEGHTWSTLVWPLAGILSYLRGRVKSAFAWESFETVDECAACIYNKTVCHLCHLHLMFCSCSTEESSCPIITS